MLYVVESLGWHWLWCVAFFHSKDIILTILQHLGVFGTDQGTITFVNFMTQEELDVIKLKFQVVRMDIVSSKSFKVNMKTVRRRWYHHQQYLLIHTQGGGVWKALLEQEVDHHKYQTLFGNEMSPEFFPVCLTKFADVSIHLFIHALWLIHVKGDISVQQTKQGTLIGVYHHNTNKIELYDAGKRAVLLWGINEMILH
jgi:hypothetical protein